MKRKFVVNEDTITKCLAHLELPPHYHYEIEQFSKLVWRVWLVDTRKYDYTTDEVKTIWGFIKNDGSVMRPTNANKISSERVCHIAAIPYEMKYTTIQPKYTNLLSILN